ncbi:MAG: NUDIX domain-containing protein [Elioraea sp.]|nr:NUDIX domain-containing protein [Elioraea sp.]
MSTRRPSPSAPPAETWALAFAAALLRDPAGRYLVQVRDQAPGILHPGAYGLFGGGIEEGEKAEEAIRRELLEEIGWVPDDLRFWGTLWIPARYPGAPMRSARVEAFEGSITRDRVALLRQTEGAGRALIPPRTLLLEANVAPVARLAIGLHAQGAICRGGSEPASEHWTA